MQTQTTTSEPEDRWVRTRRPRHVARNGFLFDTLSCRYVLEPTPYTVVVNKCRVKQLCEYGYEFGATQFPEEAFRAPAQ